MRENTHYLILKFAGTVLKLRYFKVHLYRSPVSRSFIISETVKSKLQTLNFHYISDNLKVDYKKNCQSYVQAHTLSPGRAVAFHQRDLQGNLHKISFKMLNLEC